MPLGYRAIKSWMLPTQRPGDDLGAYAQHHAAGSSPGRTSLPFDGRNLTYDVVVVGGGSAGVAAAVGAAATGARTLLLERYGFLGGAATTSNVLAYCGLYAQGGAEAQAVVGGVADQVIEALGMLGVDPSPIRSPSGNWILRLECEPLKLALDHVVQRSRADLLLHAQMIEAEVAGASITSVSISDLGRTLRIYARAFVDASGDAVLAAAVGVPLDDSQGERRPRQPGSLPIRVGGVPTDGLDRAALQRALSHVQLPGEERSAGIRRDGGIVLRLPMSNEMWWMVVDVETGDGGASAKTAAETLGRELAWRCVEALRRHVPGCEHAYLLSGGPQIGIRDSRQVIARQQVTSAMIAEGALLHDSIGRGGWPMEVHTGLGRITYQPVGGAGYFGIPYRAIRATQLENLWLGGRVIGCDAGAYGSIRVMGTAFATGHAAGVAAACQADGCDPDLSSAVRARLFEQRAIL